MRRWPPPLQRLLLESNGAVNCQPITQLFPLCWAGCRVILVPWPVTSGEWVKCSARGRRCQPASHVQPERPSLPASLPEDWASSMHQWHQPSQGTCSMPNQWFIRTQLAGRHGASCHMPRGSNCNLHPLPTTVVSTVVGAVQSVHTCRVSYSTSAGPRSVPAHRAVLFVPLKQVRGGDLASLSPATQVLSWEWVTMTFISTHVAPVGSVWNTHPSTEVWGCGAPDTVNLRG